MRLSEEQVEFWSEWAMSDDMRSMATELLEIRAFVRVVLAWDDLGRTNRAEANKLWDDLDAAIAAERERLARDAGGRGGG